MRNGLGRRPAPDERDRSYPVTRLLTAVAYVPSSRHWYSSAWWGDQGEYPHCVGYAWEHWLKSGPNTQREHRPKPVDLYHAAQEVDEWEGNDYDGTSVRAGAKVLTQAGFAASYWWATTASEVAQSVLALGPVVVGTDWFAGMDNPVKAGGWRMRPTGIALGGHAYLLDGYSSVTKLFRVKNSWGRRWGRSGFAYLHRDELNVLLARNGEACVALEVTPPQAVAA